MTTIHDLLAGAQPEPAELETALVLLHWRIRTEVAEGVYHAVGFIDRGGGGKNNLIGCAVSDVIYIDPQFRWLLTSQAFVRLEKRQGER